MTVFEIIIAALTALLVILALMKGFCRMLMFIVELGIYLVAFLFCVGPISKWLLAMIGDSSGLSAEVLQIGTLAVSIVIILVALILVLHIPKHWLNKAFRKGKAVHPLDRWGGVVFVVLVMFALTSVLTAFFNDGEVIAKLLGDIPATNVVLTLFGFGKVEGATNGVTGMVIAMQNQVRNGLYIHYLIDAGNPLGQLVLNMFA